MRSAARSESRPHAVLIGVGSNLGDRQGNILQALQKLRGTGTIEAVSSFYETPPVAGVAGPAFLNIAAKLTTPLEPDALERALRAVETAVGRQRAQHLAARAIDIDILYVDDMTRAFERFAVPHPDVRSRAFNLVPLAEIAGDFIDPVTHMTVAAMAAASDRTGIAKKTRTLTFSANRQEGAPAVALSIDRVGVSNVKRVVHLTIDDRAAVFNGVFSMVADLGPDKAGVHMSRFSELLEEATLEVLAQPAGSDRIEDVVGKVATRIVDAQRALRAEVRLQADFGLERWTPVSGKRGVETYTLVGIAHADRNGLRRVVGVEAEGMTACPCAQGMVREHSHAELVEAGFSAADADRALDALPVATHNQRGRGSIMLGVTGERPGDIRPEDLVEIVENSMSSETYDLLKRPDEFFIVNKAHHNPKFVEDVVRGILAHALETYADFPDDTFVSASQVNYESIHKHDAYAEAFGTFAELQAELRGGTLRAGKTNVATWLAAR